MRAVVLVGGFGTRLRPLTFTIPKQLLPVAGSTMIERVVTHLVSHGIDDIVLSMGYRADVFHRAFPDDRCAGARLTYAVEPEPLDTAGAIRFAATFAGIDGRFVVVNGDVLTDLNISALVDFHEARRAEGTIALTRVDDPSMFGVVPTDDDGRVSAFVEKPPRDEAPTDLINAGTYVLERSVLDRIAPDRRVSIERETFPAMVTEGSLYAMASAGYWIDAGTPVNYLQANLDLLDRPGPPCPDAGEAAPGVWVVGHPVIEGDVIGPCVLSDGAAVGDGAVVEGSVLAPGATVLPGAVVRRSVLVSGAIVRPGALVEDSMIGDGAVIGDGAKVSAHSVIGGGVEVAPNTHLTGERVPEQ